MGQWVQISRHILRKSSIVEESIITSKITIAAMGGYVDKENIKKMYVVGISVTERKVGAQKRKVRRVLDNL